MPKMNRSRHNLSHHRLTTFNLGQLVPIACMEVLMGDSFSHVSAALMRVATLVNPVMHPMDVRIHHWFVPNRIVWDEWDTFITGKTTNPVPTINFVQASSTYTLANHMGLPNFMDYTVQALPFRAYNKIWNEFYRDQDLQTERAQDDVTLANVNWAKDYFTTARPSPQEGSAVGIPISGIGALAGQTPAAGPINVVETGGNDTYGNAYTGTDIRLEALGSGAGAAVDARIDIEEMRLALAMQRHIEARARYGDRFQDFLAYHGIRPRDSRLGLPEYLGGGKSTVAFSEVLATAEGTNTDVGDMAGHGIAAIRTRRYNRFFPESGWMLSLCSVRPRPLYTTVLHRQWLRSNRFDYWQKEFEILGRQAVLVKEIWADHGNLTDVFGYQGRHDEYRRFPSHVAGQFSARGDAVPNPGVDLDWHLGRVFVSAPTLNSSFVNCDPTDRIFADTNAAEFKMMVSHNLHAKRLVRKQALH